MQRLLNFWFLILVCTTGAYAVVNTNETVYTQSVESGDYLDVVATEEVDTSGVVVIKSGADVRFWAGDKVTLKPGFHAKAGSSFRAATDSDMDGLADLDEAGVDSDGDGIGDTQEVSIGQDPFNAADAYVGDINGDGFFDELIDAISIDQNMGMEQMYYHGFRETLGIDVWPDYYYIYRQIPVTFWDWWYLMPLGSWVPEEFDFLIPPTNALIMVGLNGYYVVVGCSDTQTGETYQFQTREDSGASWANLGGALPGNGYGITYLSNVLWYQYDDVGDHFRVVKLGKASALVGSPVTADVFGDSGTEVFQEATPEVTATADTTHTIELAHGTQSGLDDVIAVIVPKGSTPTTPGVAIEILGVKIAVTASGKVSFSFPTAIFGSADDWSFYVVYGDANDEISVGLDLMWETANKANQIFNLTRKDDPVNDSQVPDANGDSYGIDRHKLYVVESPVDSQYHVTIEVDDQPSSLRNLLMYAVYDGGSKLAGTDGFFPASGPADIAFDHPALSAAVLKDFEIRVGHDFNGNNTLDSGEILSPLKVKDGEGNDLGPPTVRGASVIRYGIDAAVVNVGVADVLLPHARRLLQIFRDGNKIGVPVEKKPTTSGTIGLNAFSGEYSEWLTHNGGAVFSPAGAASIPYHQWDPSTSLAEMVGSSHQIEDAAEDYYDSTIKPIVTAYFASQPVGHVRTFPSSTTFYSVPHMHESPAWVTATTVEFDEPLQVNGVYDDINGTIGRGRLTSHQAQYTVEKKSILGVMYLDVTQSRYKGEVQDLYDFNQEAGGPPGAAATVQIGYGDGGYGRTKGVVYRSRIEFNKTIANPF
ncbi:MAG: hypothetical protein DRP71_09405 [Verrucomicrobia bacterium]|nr:MAG: hypothetical protein DRP71_09405 [Verrucomicrobiota bacterium]